MIPTYLLSVNCKLSAVGDFNPGYEPCWLLFLPPCNPLSAPMVLRWLDFG